MRINTVFFDMGGTIETFGYTKEFRLENVHVIKDCLAKKSIFLSWTDEQLVEAITKGAKDYLLWNMISHIELNSANIWSRFFLQGQLLTPEELTPISEELAFLYETRLFYRAIRPEIPEVLKKIKKLGFRMGIISNTQSFSQVPFSLQQYQILEYFNPIILSSEYGWRKPDPAIFYHAAQMAGLPTGACVYVGDKINRDIVGAKRSGFQLAIQIKHEYYDGIKDEGAIPDAIIDNMKELIPILEQATQIVKQTPQSRNNQKVKAIFFDAGDILYHRPKKDNYFQKFLLENSIFLNSDFEKQRQQFKELAFTGKISQADYYLNTIKLLEIQDEEKLAAGMEALRKDDDNVKIIKGVPATIQKLKEKGFTLGIITDTAVPVTKKLSWFDQHGFGGLWDVYISSKEVGVRKPNPIMYEKAICQSGFKSNETAFVGHKNSELEGARASGMHTIAFNYDEDAEAEFFIDQFADLLTLPILQK